MGGKRRFAALAAAGGLLVSSLVAGAFSVGEAAAAGPCPDPDPPLATDLKVRQAPPLPEPRARTPFRDPAFQTCQARLTDRAADIAPDDKSRGLKNEYSRVQAFNADETAILIRGTAATWYLYDAATLKRVRKLGFDGPVEPRWDAADPNLLHFIDGTRLFAFDVKTDQRRLLRDFAGILPGQRLAAVWTRAEGSPSFDGRFWGLMAEDENWLPVAFLVYDRAADRIVALRDMRGVPGIKDDVDHVGMSPLGTYFVAAFDRYCERGQIGNDAKPCGLMVYDRDLKNGRNLRRIIGHYDLALDADRREVIVYQDVDSDQIAMLDLASGRVTALRPIDFSRSAIGLHFSGRASGRPGWALVSTHDDSAASHTWMDDQVFAIELKAGGRVVRLAHTRSLVNPKMEHDYWAEPQATVNRGFTRVLFTTNWGRSGTDQVETMLIDLPADWPGRLRP
jgi:hypothetical protein